MFASGPPQTTTPLANSFPFASALNHSSSNGIANGHGDSNGVASPGAGAIVMRRLPLNTSSEVLRSMLLFAKDLVDVEFIHHTTPDDAGFATAMAVFRTLRAAEEAQAMLHGKPNPAGQATMIVDLITNDANTAALSRRNTIDQLPYTLGRRPQLSPSTLATITPNQRPDIRAFDNTLEQSVSMNGAASTNVNSTSLPPPDSGSGLNTLFAAQPNGVNDRPRVSGKSMINQEDEDTGELLRNSVAFAQNEFAGPASAPQLTRRATNPITLSQIPPSLTLGTHLTSASIHAFGPGSMSMTNTPVSSGSAISPGIGGMGMGMGRPYNQPMSRHNYPPVNPADQNPPCNTLYVGNLPPDTSEDELKSLFSRQRGYKRMVFRCKSNGPICFVEFEDVSLATRALNELYGYQLSNSVKGGIRLSFSKNPLGVRSGQPGSMHPATPLSSNGPMSGANGFNAMGGPRFSTASGPPPGLAAPPGQAFRPGYFY